MSVTIGIAGASGKIARMCLSEAQAQGRTVAAFSRAPETALPEGAIRAESLAALAEISDVVIDFTHHSATPGIAGAVSGKAAWVIGTSGLGAGAREAIAAAAAAGPVFEAANFSLGMNLVFMLAEKLASKLPAEEYDAEIVDIFHRRKVDAPSGTAMALGARVARGRGKTLEELRVPARVGDVGARRTGEIGFSSLRGGASNMENQLVLSGANDQTVLIHRVHNPAIYARSALVAADWVLGRAPGLYGMEDMIGEALK